jgi:hypothetical protein
VFYFEKASYPKEEKWLADGSGLRGMSGRRLSSTGVPIARTTVQPWTDDEKQTDTYKVSLEKFDLSVKTRLDTPALLLAADNEVFDDTGDDEMRPKDQNCWSQMKMIWTDTWTNSCRRPSSYHVGTRTVKQRKRDADGKPIGVANLNHLLDTRVYEVELTDGAVAEYTANLIAISLYEQVDEHANEFILM